MINMMTKLLAQAVEKASLLPEGRQDELAHALLTAAEADLHPYVFTTDERAVIHDRLAKADLGDFASEEQVAGLWRRFGL